MNTIKRGDSLPGLILASSGDKTINLAEFKNKKLVLYFYPRDNTPGCTKEGEDFRDLHPEFTQADTVIIGVSRDSAKKHDSFIAKYGFPFDLLADVDEVLCKAFDVIKTKNMYGKKVLGIERSTFLFDNKGVLQKEWRKVKVTGHAEEVLQAARDLG